MKKRNILIILTILFLLVLTRNNVYTRAAEAPTISVNYVEAATGQEVTLFININNNPGICTIRLAVHYDPLLTLIKVTDSGLLKENTLGGDTDSNPYYIMWDESLANENNKGNGVLASLTFKVSDLAAAGNYRVWLTYEKGDIFNLDLEDIDFNLIDGGVKVSNTEAANNAENNTAENNNAENNNSGNNNSEDNIDNVTASENTEITKPAGTKFSIVTTGSDGKIITSKYMVETEKSTGTENVGYVKLISLKTSTSEVIIPETVENDNITYIVDCIAPKALKSNKKVKSLIIGQNIKTIGSYAFKGMKKLKSITIYPSSLQEVDEGAFSGIYKKATIKIKVNKKMYKKIVSMIKSSKTNEKVTFKRIK